MRYMAVAFLCATSLTANAATVDYTVAKDPNGFNVYEVTKDKLTKVLGSPFGSSLTQFVATDGPYFYVVNWVSPPPPIPSNDYNAQLVTYTMTNGKLKQIAAIMDNALAKGESGSTLVDINWITATPQHVFMTVVTTSSSGARTFVHMFHKHSDGSLTVMCDMGVDFNIYNTYLTSVTNIRVDANEIYAYITYTDYNTQLPVTGIYDISTGACKQVGTVGQ